MAGWGIILWSKNSHLQCKLIWAITNFDKLKLKLSQAISSNFAVKLRRTEVSFFCQCKYRVIRWNIILMSNIYCATDDVLIDSSLRNILPFEQLHCKCNTQQMAFIVILRPDYYSLSMKQWNHKNWRRRKGEIISTHHRGILRSWTYLQRIWQQNPIDNCSIEFCQSNLIPKWKPSLVIAVAMHRIPCDAWWPVIRHLFLSLAQYWSCRKK